MNSQNFDHFSSFIIIIIVNCLPYLCIFITQAVTQRTVQPASNSTEKPTDEISDKLCYQKMICAIKREVHKAANKLLKAVNFAFCCLIGKEPKKILQEIIRDIKKWVECPKLKAQEATTTPKL